MDEIGSELKLARESSGVSISEASKDLDLSELTIENIEDGKIGAFKDVFELKKILSTYAKYLGLDDKKIIDEFNVYLFEYTSKIPVKELEKTIEMQLKEENDSKKIISPYTKKETKIKKNYLILIYSIAVILLIIIVVWAVSELFIGNQATDTIGYYR